MQESTGTTQDALSGDKRQVDPPQRAVLVIADLTTRRFFTSVLESLRLTVDEVDSQNWSAAAFRNLEVVVADENVAGAIRTQIDEDQSTGKTLKPLLVAIGPRTPDGPEQSYDAFIAVPSMMSEVSSRLSVVLYSHRALARRYQSALEELSLNRDIFRSVSNGISVANAQMHDLPLMYVNPSFELMTGYSLEEVQGKNCRFLQGDDRDQPGLTLVREAIANKRQTTAILRNFRKDGSVFWNELTLSPIFNHEGVLTHFVGIQLDVSDRVRVETALRESEKLAAVGRLASTISHEINNPLEAVTNLVYLAKENATHNEDRSELLQYLTTADDELRRVKAITAQSLRFAKQSSEAQAVRLNDLIESVLDVYRARIRNYGVDVVQRLRSTQHVVLFESEIRQVISNLLNNSIDAMKTRHHRVLTIRTRESTDLRNHRNGVLLTISDSGAGIPAEAKKQIYDAFYSTKGMGGTGLGLWVVKGIVERHHGTLLLRSSTEAEKSSTTFQIFLPFQAATEVDASERTHTQHEMDAEVQTSQMEQESDANTLAGAVE